WSGYYRVHRIADGVPQDLQFAAVRRNVRPADGDVIRVVLRPDDGIFVAVNGVTVFDGGDTRDMGSTRWGLMGTDGVTRFDDLVISEVMSALTTTDTFTRPDGFDLGAPETGVGYHWRVPTGAWELTGGALASISPWYSL